MASTGRPVPYMEWLLDESGENVLSGPWLRVGAVCDEFAYYQGALGEIYLAAC